MQIKKYYFLNLLKKRKIEKIILTFLKISLTLIIFFNYAYSFSLKLWEGGLAWYDSVRDNFYLTA